MHSNLSEVQSGGTISIASLEFDRVPVQAAWSSGVPFEKWVRVGMPRLSQEILDCTFFLFRNKDDAEQCRDPVGTGFIVGMPSQWPGYFHLYAVTNWHVAITGRGSVIGLNKIGGGIDAIETEPTDWFWNPKGDDLAIIPLPVKKDFHRLSHIERNLFATERDVEDFHIGFGDDVFMLGLLVDHGAKTKTLPKARFGNISMMPDDDAKIKQPNGNYGADFVMDMHSREGFSGSPVFMYRTPGADLSFVNADPKTLTGKEAAKYLNSPPVFCFMGLHWGQFPENWKIEQERGEESFFLRDPSHIEGVSGLTCVIPSWRILSYLDKPEFENVRRATEVRIKKTNPSIDSHPKAEVSEPPTKADNPSHKEDFNRLLGEAVRTPKPDRQT